MQVVTVACHCLHKQPLCLVYYSRKQSQVYLWSIKFSLTSCGSSLTLLTFNEPLTLISLQYFTCISGYGIKHKSIRQFTCRSEQDEFVLILFVATSINVYVVCIILLPTTCLVTGYHLLINFMKDNTFRFFMQELAVQRCYKRDMQLY